jgi:hypothetical protein
MEKQFLHYSALINRTALILILFFFGIGCNTEKAEEEKEEYAIIKKYFEERHQFNLNKDTKQIIVLSENGCVPCNKKFAAFISDSIDKGSSIILITASGARIDLSKFGVESENVFFDQNIYETAYQLFYESKIIFISGNSIDTIITLDARQIEQQFELILKRQ